MLCSIFELRALSISGFAPQPYTTCVSCGAILESEENRILFSYSECGFICGKCKKNGTPASSILIDTAHAVCHIVNSESKALFNFGVSSQVSSELAKLSGRYLRERLDYDFKKLDMIKDL